MSTTYLTVQALAQTTDASLQVSTLLKYLQPSFEVSDVLLQTFRLNAGSTISVPITSLNYLCLVAVRSTLPVDVSIRNGTGGPVYTGFPSVFYMRSWQTGVLIDHLMINAAQATDVEVCVAGRRTAV